MIFEKSEKLKYLTKIKKNTFIKVEQNRPVGCVDLRLMFSVNSELLIVTLYALRLKRKINRGKSPKMGQLLRWDKAFIYGLRLLAYVRTR